MSKLHEAMTFTAVLPNGKTEEFSLAEYLAWWKHNGMKIPDADIADLIDWLNAENNNFGRMSCWLSVQQFQKELSRIRL